MVAFLCNFEWLFCGCFEWLFWVRIRKKVDALAKVIGIHPLTLLTLTYLVDLNEKDPTRLLRKVEDELSQIFS